MNDKNARLAVEKLEDRVTPAWAGLAPARIPIPRESLAVTLDTQGDATGTGTNVNGENAFARFRAPRTGSYTFSAGAAEGSTIDTVIGVFGSTGRRLGSNDDIAPPENTDSRLTLRLVAGQTYYFGITRYTSNGGGDFVWGIDGPGAQTTPPPNPGPGPGPAPGGFQISLRFGSGLTASQQAIFRQAAARWERAIVGDLPNATFRGVTVDDVLIDARGVRIDGPSGVLGQAGPDAFRTGSLLPIHGEMEFDSADLASLERSGGLLDTITHEMGHVLGVGTLWRQLGLLQGAGSNAPRFTGRNATAEYDRLTGRASNGVPVENGGGDGTRESHWEDDVFNNELMTGFLNSGVRNPLSRMTIASMADMGYQVNLAAGEAYTLPGRVVIPEAAGTPTGREAAPARPADVAPPVDLTCPAPNARSTAALDVLFTAL